MAQFNNGFQPYTPFGTPGNIQSGTSDDIQGVRLVSSIEEVRASSVPYGFRLMFMNGNDPFFYIKDSTGGVRVFKFQEVDPPVPENFVTRKEFDELRKNYESLIQQRAAEQSQQYQQPVQQPQSYANNAGNAELSGNTGASQGTVYAANTGDGMEPGPNQSVPV